MRYNFRNNGLSLVLRIFSLILIIHFSISIIIWLFFLYGSITLTSKEKDWSIFINFIPSIALFTTSVLAYKFARSKTKKAILILLLTLLISILSFVYETSNHYCQMQTPIYHFEQQFSYISLGYKERYNNWWWYEKVIRTAPERKQNN